MVLSMVKEIIFDKAVKHQILELFGKTLDAEGYIVEKDNPSQRVLTFDEGREITFDDFGGLQKGSEVFIKNNLVSLIRLSKR